MSADESRQMLTELDEKALEGLYVKEQKSTHKIAKISRMFGVSFKKYFLLMIILGHLNIGGNFGGCMWCLHLGITPTGSNCQRRKRKRFPILNATLYTLGHLGVCDS